MFWIIKNINSIRISFILPPYLVFDILNNPIILINSPYKNWSFAKLKKIVVLIVAKLHTVRTGWMGQQLCCSSTYFNYEVK